MLFLRPFHYYENFFESTAIINDKYWEHSKTEYDLEHEKTC